MNQTERFDVKLSNLDISEEDPVGGSGHEFEEGVTRPQHEALTSEEGTRKLKAVPARFRWTESPTKVLGEFTDTKGASRAEV